MVNCLAAQSQRRLRQQPARPSRGDRILENVLVRSDEHLAAVIGLKDIIVVATGDAVLVADKSQTDKVKQLVERLKAEAPTGSHGAPPLLSSVGSITRALTAGRAIK